MTEYCIPFCGAYNIRNSDKKKMTSKTNDYLKAQHLQVNTCYCLPMIDAHTVVHFTLSDP